MLNSKWLWYFIFNYVDATPALDKPGSRASGDKLSGGQGGGSPTPHTLVAVPRKGDDLDGR